MTPTVTTRSARLDEALVSSTLEDGLPVVVVPKPGYLKSVALLTVAYGAVDVDFTAPGESGVVKTPAGVAHFLEHKLFEDQAGDVFDQFARLGASANAYTSLHETGYHFATSERFERCLDLLLDFVTDPFFTQEQIEKERAVIAQEIRMSEDDADSRGHRALLRALYHAHPVKEEVAGTVESIAAIDKAQLERCHRAFYRPSNMLLVVAGDLDPEAVFAQVEAGNARRTLERAAALEAAGAAPLPALAGGAGKRVLAPEPAMPRTDHAEERMPVSLPRLLLGWKADPPPSGPALLERTLETLVLLELLFGRSSAFFETHYKSGLIDGSFSHAWDAGRSGYAYALVGGETHEPERLAEAVEARLAEARAGDLDAKDVERLRAKAYGQFVRSWNGVDQVAAQVSTAHTQGWDLFRYLELVEQVTLDRVVERLKTFDRSRRASSIVRPLAKS
jgi:predicted Zn-dependent peptidase